MNFFDRVKQKTWRVIYKFFPTFQHALLRWGIIHHNGGRQRYHIGWLRAGKTLEDLKMHLHTKWGFGNHFVAWTDSGQVLSWRKLTDFEDQYHLRVFEDGEICGHYELTPEAHPLDHFKEKGEINKKEDFLKFLGEYVTDRPAPGMHLKMDPNAFNPDSEVTVDRVNQSI